MSNLIVINGPTGVGKTTVARLLHEQLNPSYLLSGDSIRRFLNDYHDFPREARTLRNKLVLGMLDVLMKEGINVVLEQLHTDTKMLDEYSLVAKKHHRKPLEYFLWIESEDALYERFDNREHGPTRHPNTSLTEERVRGYWHKMKYLTEEREEQKTILTDNLSAQDVVNTILEDIGSS